MFTNVAADAWRAQLLMPKCGLVCVGVLNCADAASQLDGHM